jgi:DHA2 family multidrug resistance protein-like MFS transporter
MAPAIQGLPAPAGAAAGDSIGGAVEVAVQIGGTSGEALLQTARSAFANGMSDALIVATLVAFAGALVALFFLPARALDPSAQEADREPPTDARDVPIANKV